MEIPKCPVQFEIYTSDGPNCPMVLLCGHTICEYCLNTIFENEHRLACPICSTIFWNKDGVKKNFALCSSDYGQCIPHKKLPAKYCSTHTVCLCEECKHDGCVLVDWAEDMYEIWADLLPKVEAVWQKVYTNQMPKTVCFEYQGRKKLSHVKLFQLYLKVSEYMTNCLRCWLCGKPATRIDTGQLSAYCEVCSAVTQGKMANVCENRPNACITFTDDLDANAIQRLVQVGRVLLGKCHFCYLTNQHYQSLQNPSSVSQTLELLREIQGIIGLKELQVVEFPDVVICPECKREIKKVELNMWKLPCANVLHALCEGCLRGAAMVTCPLDQKKFITSGIREALYFPQKPITSGLSINASPQLSRNQPPTTSPGTLRPSSLSRVPFTGSGQLSARPNPQLLVGVGVPVPPLVPDYGLKHVTKFQMLFPLQLLPAELQPLAQLCQGWPVRFNGPRKQVEAMSFMVFAHLEIVGLSIGNPVNPNESIQIEWIKLYNGLATMEREQDLVYAKPNILTGGGYITDIFFDRPLRVCDFKEHTIKLKFAPMQLGTDLTLLYGGNHMSRPEDSSGSDGLYWNFVETHGVGRDESCTLQLNLAGPIIRVIYRTLTP